MRNKEGMHIIQMVKIKFERRSTLYHSPNDSDLGKKMRVVTVME